MGEAFCDPPSAMMWRSWIVGSNQTSASTGSLGGKQSDINYDSLQSMLQPSLAPTPSSRLSYHPLYAWQQATSQPPRKATGPFTGSSTYTISTQQTPGSWSSLTEPPRQPVLNGKFSSLRKSACPPSESHARLPCPGPTIHHNMTGELISGRSTGS